MSFKSKFCTLRWCLNFNVLFFPWITACDHHLVNLWIPAYQLPAYIYTVLISCEAFTTPRTMELLNTILLGSIFSFFLANRHRTTSLSFIVKFRYIENSDVAVMLNYWSGRGYKWHYLYKKGFWLIFSIIWCCISIFEAHVSMTLCGLI